MHKQAKIEKGIFEGFARAMRERFNKERNAETYDPYDSLSSYREEGLHKQTGIPREDYQRGTDGSRRA